MGKDRKYSIEDLNKLINSIKSAENLTEEDIAVKLGYNYQYISQIRARGFVPDKFMEALKREFAKSKHLDIKDGNVARMSDNDFVQPSTGQLLDTINLLIRQNDKLADTNRILSEKIATIPVGDQSETQRSVDAMLQGLREFALKVSVGSRYTSIEEARAAYRKELGGVLEKTKARGIHDGSGK